VQCPDDDGDNHDSLYYVDVGFGEPPLQPLRYGNDVFGTVQVTCEGMRSRMDRINDEEVVLSYWIQGEWRPRMKWNHSDCLRGNQGPCITDEIFRNGLQSVHDPSSIFSKKLICCLLTRNRKVTLAGHKFKVTEPRGFFEGEEVVEPTVVDVATNDDGRRILETHFGIPMTSSVGLDLDDSRLVDPAIWSQL